MESCGISHEQQQNLLNPQSPGRLPNPVAKAPGRHALEELHDQEEMRPAFQLQKSVGMNDVGVVHRMQQPRLPQEPLGIRRLPQVLDRNAQPVRPAPGLEDVPEAALVHPFGEDVFLAFVPDDARRHPVEGLEHALERAPPLAAPVFQPLGQQRLRMGQDTEDALSKLDLRRVLPMPALQKPRRSVPLNRRKGKLPGQGLVEADRQAEDVGAFVAAKSRVRHQVRMELRRHVVERAQPIGAGRALRAVLVVGHLKVDQLRAPGRVVQHEDVRGLQVAMDDPQPRGMHQRAEAAPEHTPHVRPGQPLRILPDPVVERPAFQVLHDQAAALGKAPVVDLEEADVADDVRMRVVPQLLHHEPRPLDMALVLGREVQLLDRHHFAGPASVSIRQRTRPVDPAIAPLPDQRQNLERAEPGWKTAGGFRMFVGCRHGL